MRDVRSGSFTYEPEDWANRVKSLCTHPVEELDNLRQLAMRYLIRLLFPSKYIFLSSACPRDAHFERSAPSWCAKDYTRLFTSEFQPSDTRENRRPNGEREHREKSSCLDETGELSYVEIKT